MGSVDAELPRAVYRAACAAIAAALEGDGFRFRRSGPDAARTAGDFTHRVSFQSNRYNRAGESVALWIHATVESAQLAAWLRGQGHTEDVGTFAGGQIGNLERKPNWREWDFADATRRTAVVSAAVRTIREVALPLFDRFVDDATALAALDELIPSAAQPVPAIQFALSRGARDSAQRYLEGFFSRRADLYAAYVAHVAEYQRGPLPGHWHMSYAQDLAKATVLYGLTPARNPAG